MRKKDHREKDNYGKEVQKGGKKEKGVRRERKYMCKKEVRKEEKM